GTPPNNVASRNSAVGAESYGKPRVQVDGNDPLGVYKAVRNGKERAINGEGPSLIEAVTDRLTAHSSDDNDKLYRTEEEINEMKENDCVHTFAAYLTDLGILTKEKSEAMDKEIKQEINE